MTRAVESERGSCREFIMLEQLPCIIAVDVLDISNDYQGAQGGLGSFSPSRADF